MTPQERRRLQEMEAALSRSQERERDLQRYFEATKEVYDRNPDDPEAQEFFNQADALYKHGQAGG